MRLEDEKEFYYQIGSRIKFLRERAGLKQEAFAQLLGLSRASIVNIEKGRQNPSFFLICKIITGLNLTFDDILVHTNNEVDLSHITIDSNLEQKIFEIAEIEFDNSQDTIHKLRSFVIDSLSIN